MSPVHIMIVLSVNTSKKKKKNQLVLRIILRLPREMSIPLGGLAKPKY